MNGARPSPIPPGARRPGLQGCGAAEPPPPDRAHGPGAGRPRGTDPAPGPASLRPRRAQWAAPPAAPLRPNQADAPIGRQMRALGARAARARAKLRPEWDGGGKLLANPGPWPELPRVAPDLSWQPFAAELHAPRAGRGRRQCLDCAPGRALSDCEPSFASTRATPSRRRAPGEGETADGPAAHLAPRARHLG